MLGYMTFQLISIDCIFRPKHIINNTSLGNQVCTPYVKNALSYLAASASGLEPLPGHRAFAEIVLRSPDQDSLQNRIHRIFWFSFFCQPFFFFVNESTCWHSLILLRIPPLSLVGVFLGCETSKMGLFQNCEDLF